MNRLPIRPVHRASAAVVGAGRLVLVVLVVLMVLKGRRRPPSDDVSAAERVFIGLGANLGDPRAALLRAFEQLASLPGTRLVARSSLYRTLPVDAQGPDFCNAVAELATTIEPQDLLQALQDIENSHGRQRPFFNAPRTLDLDLLLFGQRQIDDRRLTVPHPRLHQRAFVLVPLQELAPDLTHPLLGPLTKLALGLHEQPIERLT